MKKYFSVGKWMTMAILNKCSKKISLTHTHTHAYDELRKAWIKWYAAILHIYSKMHVISCL